jgi:hypothetical protein
MKGGDLMGRRIGKMLCMAIMGLMLTQAGSLGYGQEKKEGWANVPGGQVWLEPGRQAYEHDTGLVRDLVTGQKSRPITPQSLMQPQPQCQPCEPNVVAPLAVNPRYPLNPYPAPYPAPYPVYPQPYPQPYPAPYPISVQPVPPTYVRPWFDLGPNSVYLPSYSNGRSGYGVKLGSTRSINQQWKQTRLPK